MADEQYIAAGVAAYPADRGFVFVTNRGTGRPDFLPEQFFSILRQVNRFDTVAGHTRKLFTTGWEDDGSGFIESVLKELVHRGLMVSKSAFLNGLRGAHRGLGPPPPVTSVMITTRDRTPLLQRCLNGFIENNDRHGRTVNYLVMDDSRIENQNEKTRILETFASKGKKIFYAGLKEKVGFVQALVQAGTAEGLPEEVMTFCLFGDEGWPTYGANRNALLLATAGELVVMSDDDAVYQSLAYEEHDKTLALTSLNDPTILRYFGDRQELLASVDAADIGVLSCHEKLLGRSIADCRESLGQDYALEVGQLSPEAVLRLSRADTAVNATMSGYWGDSGMGSPNAAVELMGEARDLVMRSQALYVRATNSREVFRSASRYTIGDGSLFMTNNAGLDNRALLPPFLPVGRDEDGIFALTLHACKENALIGHLPFAVYHAPEEARCWPPGAFLDPTPRIAEIVGSIVISFASTPGVQGADRMSALGRYFIELSRLETRDFENHLRGIWLSSASHYMGFLEDLLDLHHGEPDYWARDIETFKNNFKDFILHGSPAVPRELLGKQPPDQAKESCKRLVGRFGELLYWWPVIRGAAKKLSDDGVRLVRPI